MRPSCLLLLLLPLACVGPEASDAEVCRDTVQRLCLARACPGTAEALALPEDCQGALGARTGCADEAFTFRSPERARFLSCRAPLVRTSAQVGQAPACEEMAEMLEGCPDVVAFLKGESR